MFLRGLNVAEGTMVFRADQRLEGSLCPRIQPYPSYNSVTIGTVQIVKIARRAFRVFHNQDQSIVTSQAISVRPTPRLRMALAIVVSCLGAIDFQFAEAKMAVRPSLPLAPSDVPSATLEMLRGASGTLTPAVRASYVNWAREKVIGQSSAAKSAVPEDVLYKIESDTTLSDAIFASVYPPDR